MPDRISTWMCYIKSQGVGADSFCRPISGRHFRLLPVHAGRPFAEAFWLVLLPCFRPNCSLWEAEIDDKLRSNSS